MVMRLLREKKTNNAIVQCNIPGTTFLMYNLHETVRLLHIPSSEQPSHINQQNLPQPWTSSLVKLRSWCSQLFFFFSFQYKISIPKLMLLLTCEPWQKKKKDHWTLKSFLSEKNLQSGHMSVNWKLPLLSSVQTSLAGWLPQWRNKSTWIWPCEV